jgi:hypothetical protein
MAGRRSSNKETGDVITRDDLTTLLNKLRNDMKKDMETSFFKFKKDMDLKFNELNKENKMLKNEIIVLHKKDEQRQMNEKSCNVIISGVPEGNQEMANQVINHLLDQEHLPDRASTVVVDFTRLGKQTENKVRPIKATLRSKAFRNTLMKHCKTLRDAGPSFKNVYVNPDLPPATLLENSRLRKHVRVLKESDKDADIKLFRGELKFNNEVVDSFDIANQLFLDQN